MGSFELKWLTSGKKRDSSKRGSSKRAPQEEEAQESQEGDEVQEEEKRYLNESISWKPLP